MNNNNVKEGYKMTEIGEIPKEWEVKKIGEIADVVTGKTPPTKNKEYYGGLYPWVTPTDIIEGKKDILETKRQLSEKGFNKKAIQLPANSVLVTCIASIGKNAILRQKGSCNQQINAILPNHNFNAEYIYYWISNNSSVLNSYAAQTAVPILNKNTFKMIKIPVPPIKEQEKIASILSTVDEHIEQTDKLIEKTKKLKKGLMQKLLTKGIGHMEFKRTEKGEIPVEWKVKKLGEIAEIIMGQSPQSSSYNDKGDGLPFFQGKTEFGEIYPNIKNWCNKPIKISEPDDILLSVRAPVGDVNINNVKSCIGRGLAAIRYTKYSNFKFLFYMLKQSKQQFQKNAQGSTFTAINSNDIKNLKIPVPPLQEQQKIASILSEVDNQIEQYQLKKEKLETLKKGLMQQLLTGKKRVKVQ